MMSAFSKTISKWRLENRLIQKMFISSVYENLYQKKILFLFEIFNNCAKEATF